MSILTDFIRRLFMQPPEPKPDLDLSDKLVQCQNELTTTYFNNDNLINAMREKDKSIGSLTAQNSTLKQSLEDIRSEYSSLKLAINESSQLSKQLVNKLTEDLDHARVRNKKLTGEIAGLNKNITDLQNQLAVKPVPPPVITESLNYETLPQWLYDKIKPVRDIWSSEYWPGLWWELDKQLWRLFGLPEIRPYENITGDDLKNRVIAAYNGQDNDHPKLEIPEMADGMYRVTTIANVKRIFLTSYVGIIPYIAELFDCDDFASELKRHFSRYMLNSVMTVYGDSAWGYHSYNLVVCSDGIALLEPQMVGKADQAVNYFKVLPEIIPGWIARKIRDI